MRQWTAITVLAFLFATAPMAVAGVSVQGQEKSYRGGLDTCFPWTSKDINACREEGKPILLYVYDPGPDEKSHSTMAREFETKIFTNELVQKAFAGFTFVRVTPEAQTWPPEYLKLLPKQVKLYVMTCEAFPLPGLVFDRSNMPKLNVSADKRMTYPLLTNAAQAVTAANPAALARIKGRPLPQFVPPVAANQPPPPPLPPKAEPVVAPPKPLPGLAEKKEQPVVAAKDPPAAPAPVAQPVRKAEQKTDDEKKAEVKKDDEKKGEPKRPPPDEE